MTDELLESARDAFEAHEAFEPTDGGYRVTTTAFDGRVTAETADAEWALRYTITVTVPAIESAVADGDVGGAVADGWLETLERRLEDAPKATRASVDLDEFAVEKTDGTVEVTYGFAFGDAGRAADVAKTFVEYVEGTYVEGIVPGYDYESPVADLLQSAAHGDDERSGTPL